EFLGTPSFMAPEQAQSPAVDFRADIYSLGITLYFLLYGKLPFEASTAIEMLVKHASQPFPTFDDLGGRIPTEAYDVVLKMTKKLPEERYQDYSMLIADLEQLRASLLRQSQWKIPRAHERSASATITGTNYFDVLADIYNRNLSGVLHLHW